ncbi:MAG: DNA-binding protein [Planctomycetaceae bacterium]|nr:DNA-binding protein [Planctomycetaceae bacterium]
MNKGDLVELVAADLGGPRSHAEKAVRAVLDAVLEGVERDGSVTLAGFGTFERKHREARPGRNPRTGEALVIPASSTVAFRPAAALKRIDAPSESMVAVAATD